MKRRRAIERECERVRTVEEDEQEAEVLKREGLREKFSGRFAEITRYGHRERERTRMKEESAEDAEVDAEGGVRIGK